MAHPDAGKIVAAARMAQIMQLIKENQLVTALALLSSGRPAHF